MPAPELLRSVARCVSERPWRNSPRDGHEEERSGESTALFHCPECDDVYVATEKATCSKCETHVEQVRSTLIAE